MKINRIELDGNNNLIIQGVDKSSRVYINEINWNEIKEKLNKDLYERIKELKEALSSKDLLLKKSEKLFDKEKLELTEEISNLQSKLEFKENQLMLGGE